MVNVRKRPVVLIVRDGWGENPFPEWNNANAIHLANRPIDLKIQKEYPTVLIRTSGEDVGLPVGIMGNSEVGHQNIGAGRIVDQELLRISKMVRTKEIFKNQMLIAAMNHAIDKRSKLHFLGLASDAGVHSSLGHLYGLLEMAKHCGVPGDRIFVHNFSDGRDCAPKSGIELCRAIEQKLKELGVGRIASVIGRYYAMDRDNRWDRVERAYGLLTQGRGSKVQSAEQAYIQYYANPTESNRTGDEFIEPTIVTDSKGEPIATIQNGDAVIFYNFRGDRPRELSRAFCNDEFPFFGKSKDGTEGKHGFDRETKLNLFYVTLTEYESGLPVRVAIPKPPKMLNILGEHIANLGLRQFRCAETEKYPHVTFFFNDYREQPFANEDRQIIPSPKDVATYDQKPQMSAFEVTDEMVRRIDSAAYDFMVLNYANGDMVGHTGSLPAAIKAVETVDSCVGRILDAVQKQDGAVIVTADHGNCEQMIDPETGGPHTSHTTYDVPLIVVDEQMKGKTLRTGGRLADLAPTALQLLGLPIPAEMSGRSLLDP